VIEEKYTLSKKLRYKKRKKEKKGKEKDKKGEKQEKRKKERKKKRKEMLHLSNTTYIVVVQTAAICTCLSLQ